MRLLNVYNPVYIYTYMSTKTISITKDVYDMLLMEKEKDESFSDAISRIVKRRSKLSDSFGKWEMTNEEIQKFKSELHNMWQKSDSIHLPKT
jgi:predicted CopG family antitoxin